MSRIFKSTFVNLGEPLEVVMHETEPVHKKRHVQHVRSSELSGQNEGEAASSIIDDANAEADEIVVNAQQQAQQILLQAENDANLIRSQAEETGYQQGYAQGLEDGRRETEDLAHEALEIKQDLEEERANLIKSIENKVADLIIQSVKKIVGQELKTNKELILGVVVNALDKLNSGKDAVIRVSEEDFQVLEENKHAVIAQCDEISDFEIKKDLSLEVGDCIIETACGSVDASVDVQLEKFQETISELVGNDADVK